MYGPDPIQRFQMHVPPARFPAKRVAANDRRGGLPDTMLRIRCRLRKWFGWTIIHAHPRIRGSQSLAFYRDSCLIHHERYPWNRPTRWRVTLSCLERLSPAPCLWFLEDGRILTPESDTVGTFDDDSIELYEGDKRGRWVIEGSTFRPAAGGWTRGLRLEGERPPVVVLAAVAHLFDDLSFALDLKRMARARELAAFNRGRE